jgi:hypothetical protein
VSNDLTISDFSAPSSNYLTIQNAAQPKNNLSENLQIKVVENTKFLFEQIQKSLRPKNIILKFAAFIDYHFNKSQYVKIQQGHLQWDTWIILKPISETPKSIWWLA